MKPTFNLQHFSDRDNMIAQLITCIALDEKNNPLFSQAMEFLKLDPQASSSLDAAFDMFEQSINDNDTSLSDLLENTAKNACCQ